MVTKSLRAASYVRGVNLIRGDLARLVLSLSGEAAFTGGDKESPGEEGATSALLRFCILLSDNAFIAYLITWVRKRPQLL